MKITPTEGHMDELDLQQLFSQAAEFDAYQSIEDREAYAAAMAAELEEIKELLTAEELALLEE